MQEIAYAKINLALHVRERLPDGYHRIETIFAFCEDGDVLTARESDELSLEITGPFAADLSDEADNLVLKAARALGVKAALTLDKRLAVAAGLGGGSADAAAVLRMFGGEGVEEIAASLGADVPACLHSRTMRGEGRGDRLKPVDRTDLAGTPVLLVNPGIPLSTAAVFAAWDGLDRGPLTDWQSGRNDLEAAAIRLVPEITEVLAALSGARLARMSGSGATCFGLYESEGERNAASVCVADAKPDWWTLATHLRP
jgi:4-diphosphocytidyl-2-C-methyl-D-erythritol kinase